MESTVLSVSELLRSVRDTLERRFPLLWVRGELSNLSRAPSGHWYFTLKDGGAQVDCVMFRSRAAALDWEPRDGMQVEARALVTLYEPRGRFQLTVEGLRRGGLGPLFERFLRLKEKLEREGLFEPGLKRELPAHPRAIGVAEISPKRPHKLGSPSHDIIITLSTQEVCDGIGRKQTQSFRYTKLPASWMPGAPTRQSSRKSWCSWINFWNQAWQVWQSEEAER